MPSTSSTCEITESTEELEGARSICPQSSESKFSIEDDINRLFESINIRASSRASGRDSLCKNASKRPIRGSSSPASGIGISEPVSLKQALRGLCISQASEMAAMKRLSKPTNFGGHSEAGTIKRLYRAVVVETNHSGVPLNEGRGNVVEISLVPEGICSSSSDQSDARVLSSEAVAEKEKYLATESQGEESKEEIGKMQPVKSPIVRISGTVPEHEVPTKSTVSGVEKGHSIRNHVSKSTIDRPRLLRPVFSNKSFIKKKLKHDSSSASGCSSPSTIQKFDEYVGPTADDDMAVEADCLKDSRIRDMEIKDDENPSNTATCNAGTRTNHSLARVDERSGSKGKGELSQSSKSSIGDHSSTTTTSSSESSNLSSSSRGSGSRPHMSKDLRWEAIKSTERSHGAVNLRQFKLLKKLGCGDIGTVYLAELIGTNCLFALKVMDCDFLKTRKKMLRAQTEKEIMQMLDHPFLPTLYYHFSMEKLSCLVMEYCPGGDLHVLRQKQPARCFSEQAARFYVAEVLLALEYLHMLGVVYRDLKPENILIREDGHIMLSDFDLSLRCAVNPVLVTSSLPEKTAPPKKVSSPCTESSCVDPFCLHPSWQVPCFTPRLLSVASKSRKMKSDIGSQVSPLPQLVVEPTSARSNSFVGTHEYLAPEIIKGEGHGSSVDWWTFGIFLFELLYGRTPFKGLSNDETLSNVVSRSLKFPGNPIVSFHARDLIRGLLVKDPENRLGSIKGAAEIKQHAFFEGLNWALIRCAVPPELPVAKETPYAEEIMGFEVF
ncbi:hypothetical protein CDL15_Pgr025168 [Punica granatum]|nr:hypothetical protein CDL15_Pgr025168 [Punica granatum]